MSRSVHEGQGGLGGLASAGKVATTVLHVGGLGWASEKAVLERVLGRRPFQPWRRSRPLMGVVRWPRSGPGRRRTR